MPRKTSNNMNGKGDLSEDEGYKSTHKKHVEKGKKSPIPQEIKTCKIKEEDKGKHILYEVSDLPKLTLNEASNLKEGSTEGNNHLLKWVLNHYQINAL